MSDDALERADKARKAIAQLSASTVQSRQDQARSRVEQIKQRIEMLKKMLMLLGKAAAKAILVELRQLAGELGQAAAALKDSGGAATMGASVGPTTAPVVHGAATPAIGATMGCLLYTSPSPRD